MHDTDAHSSRLADAVGPCYTPASIARALDITPDQVRDATQEFELLALETADHMVVFPAFQIRDSHAVPGLPPVLSALREGIDDPWAWALWLNSTPPVIEGIAPEVSRIQQLIDGEFDRVLRAAERTASSWRS